MKHMRFLIICIAVLLLLPSGKPAKAETETAADLTKSCTFDFGSCPDAKYRVPFNSKYYQ